MGLWLMFLINSDPFFFNKGKEYRFPRHFVPHIFFDRWPLCVQPCSLYSCARGCEYFFLTTPAMHCSSKYVLYQTEQRDYPFNISFTQFVSCFYFSFHLCTVTCAKDLRRSDSTGSESVHCKINFLKPSNKSFKRSPATLWLRPFIDLQLFVCN